MAQEFLTVHRQTVHPNETYQCNQCAYKSHSKTFLKGHVQSVHEATNYNCGKCDYNTTTKENLTVHIKNAHQNAGGLEPVQIEIEAEKKIMGKKSYVSKRIKCEFCQAKFNKKETHLSHMKEVHAGIPRNEENGVDKISTVTFRKSTRNTKTTSRAPESIN